VLSTDWITLDSGPSGLERNVEDAALRAILRNSASLRELRAGDLNVSRAMHLVYVDIAAARHIKGNCEIRWHLALCVMRLNAADHPNYRAALREHDPEIARHVDGVETDVPFSADSRRAPGPAPDAAV
jgi:hypothetical protein